MPVELKKAETMVDLKVPYYSQKEEQALVKYGRRACGLTSLRMVLAYHGYSLSIEAIDQLASQVGAFEEGKGWIHAGLVNMARELGLKGYRINYLMLEDEDLNRFKPILASEGASLEEIDHLEANIHLARKKGPAAAISGLVKRGIPVIVSMETTYANTLASHMIVIKGHYNHYNKGYIVNDPWDLGPDHKISLPNFKCHWTNRAIVIYSNQSRQV